MKIGNLELNKEKILIQSMCNTDTRNVDATLKQINELKSVGCDITRLAIPDMEAARAFAKIRENSPMPLVADIHFDYKLALAAIEGGADKIRINPGNIGGDDRVKAVADACSQKNIPIRIGVNLGSIDKDIEGKYGRTPRAMVESAKKHIALLNKFDFNDIVISLKASDVIKTVEAYRLMNEECSYPLHLGVTEAGTEYSGVVKSAVGIGALLIDGIGETLRVSLTANPVEEVKAAKEILRAVGKYKGVNFVSCPTCGRCKINLIPIANKVEQALHNIDKDITVAVMGCAVNGPGEAKDADIGIAGGDGCALLFKKGEIIKKVPEDKIVDVLIEEIANGDYK